jgi:hypothetical protein
MSRLKIGNESSALQRVFTFIDGVRRYLGREPKRVILFAEDFDAIPDRPPALKPYELVRGPSVSEYQSQPRGE